MRLAAVLFVLLMGGIAAVQSIVGGTPESEAEEQPLVLAASDICTVEAATLPVLATGTREIVTIPAHKTLAVVPARFGTRTETVELVPAHRQGATFFIEQKRVIVSEPTRRLRVVEPVFETVPVAETRSVVRPRVEGGVLIEEAEPLAPLPASKVLPREARIEAVRLNAGLKMLETKVVDTDGDGDPVAAETVEIEVRTVEAHPKVETREVAAGTETVEVETVETPSRRVEVDAICTLAARPPLLRSVREALAAKGIDTGEAGGWSAAAIDVMAAEQARDTGLVSPYLLLETLNLWLPEIRMPVS